MLQTEDIKSRIVQQIVRAVPVIFSAALLNLIYFPLIEFLHFHYYAPLLVYFTVYAIMIPISVLSGNYYAHFFITSYLVLDQVLYLE